MKLLLVMKCESRDQPPTTSKAQEGHSSRRRDLRTSTCSTKRHEKNLTLADWLTVYDFVDEHPKATQGDIVRHFATLKSGALIFD